MEILSVSVAKGIYPASESNRDTNPGASLANYKVVHKGDVVYNSMRMWQGAVGSSDYDGIVSPAYVVARPVIELDSTCFGYLLKRPEMLYKYLCDSQGNSKDTQTLKYNRFADIEVTMPVNLEEQRVISACLGRVDTLITLHQRKCQYRSLYGYLSWEQRKLNEYLETSREKNESCHFGKDDVLSVSGDYGIVNQIEFQGRSYAGTSVANYGVVHKGDVVYTKSPLRINPYGIIKTNRGNDGIVSTLYAVYHPTEKTHPDFVQVYFEQNARMNNYMAPLVSKGAKNDMKVSAENALKGAVTFPGIKEQEVIASYFSQLDDLITLHQ